MNPFRFYNHQIFLESMKRGTRGGNELIKIEKIRSIGLYHDISI